MVPFVISCYIKVPYPCNQDVEHRNGNSQHGVDMSCVSISTCYREERRRQGYCFWWPAQRQLQPKPRFMMIAMVTVDVNPRVLLMWSTLGERSLVCLSQVKVASPVLLLLLCITGLFLEITGSWSMKWPGNIPFSNNYDAAQFIDCFLSAGECCT